MKQIRPAKRDKLDWAVEELEDYDSYMQRHSAAIRNSSGRLGQNRTIGGRERGRDSSTGVEHGNQDVSVPVQNGIESVQANTEEDTSRKTAPVRAMADEVDVIKEEEGDSENILNMLSSIVYSLGLTQEEVQQAISYWHSKMIVPQMDQDLVK